MNDLRSGTRSSTGTVGRVLRQPVLRQVLPGMLVSALGDGMSMVAVAWLAALIAPPDQAGVWTGLAVAAYALPARSARPCSPGSCAGSAARSSWRWSLRCGRWRSAWSRSWPWPGC